MEVYNRLRFVSIFGYSSRGSIFIYGTKISSILKEIWTSIYLGISKVNT